MAATAYAECAWVAWLSSTHRTGLTKITPIGAFDSKVDCVQRIKRMKESLEATKIEQNIVAFYTMCLPDTVDPRGRRGSDRSVHERDGHQLGADALARDTAGGVGGVGPAPTVHSSGLLDSRPAIPLRCSCAGADRVIE